MPLYTKESLEKLREKIDLFEVISSHVEFKKQGASYKALCPFHEEKTPSFMMQRGDKHYHCFGCGAHGDAIQFIMHHLRVSFGEAVESLAEKFNSPLVLVDKKEERGVDKGLLREALEIASLFYHFYLLHSEEGREALEYLERRGISLPFIERFEVGLAPQTPGLFRKVMNSRRIDEEVLLGAGLIGKEGRQDFFRDRITFPIKNAMGSVIGFSARKYKEKTFGGKYINTPETALFKKSRTLFGLHFSRERIAKERKAIIVEGQIDCLKLIEAGFNYTVASLGTAFGSEHVQDLHNLGCLQALLLFDGDEAGCLIKRRRRSRFLLNKIWSGKDERED
jgi:DNA primase